MVNEIMIPKSVEHIGDNAFSGCKELINIVFENGSQLKEIPKNMF